MTLVVAVASASFASPVLLKGDALGAVGSRLGVRAGSAQELVVGGVAFSVPGAWEELPASAVEPDRGDASSEAAVTIGSVVSGLCPGGRTATGCADGVQLTFIAYEGGKAGSLPSLVEFEEQLGAQLPHRLAGFRPGDAEMRSGADGTRWLRYSFSWREGSVVHTQVVGAYRNANGTGAVAVATGPAAALAQRTKAIDTFLASGHEQPAAGG